MIENINAELTISVQRQRTIAEYLEQNQSISVKRAAEICNVSEATARRDIDEMANAGLIERIHGGAVLHRGTGFEEYHAEKMKIMIPEKTRIAKEAAKLVKEGDSLFIDSGTTTFLLAQQLQNIKKLTVITNNLDIAYTTKLDTSSTMIVTGGIRRDGFSVLVGDIAEEFIKRLYVDIAFVGADAASVEHGVFNSNFMEIGIKQSMASSGKKVVLLADHSKFGQKALAKVCDWDKFDAVITDSGIDAETAKSMRTKVRQLILV